MIYLWLLRLLTDGSHNRNGGTPFIVVCLAKGVLGYNTLVEKGSQLIFNQVDPMLVVFVHGLEVGLHQLLDLVFDVGVFEAEIIIQVLVLLVRHLRQSESIQKEASCVLHQRLQRAPSLTRNESKGIGVRHGWLFVVNGRLAADLKDTEEMESLVDYILY